MTYDISGRVMVRYCKVPTICRSKVGLESGSALLVDVEGLTVVGVLAGV